MTRIVIIGGGASGILLAIQLLREGSPIPIDVTIIDRRPSSAGLAYSTDNDFHLLNVAAYKMSALPDQPDHFIDWLEHTTGYAPRRDGFYPRRLYRSYLFDTLKDATAAKGPDKRFRVLTGEAVDIEPSHRRIVLASGEVVHYDKIVLALGNADPAPLGLSANAYLRDDGYHPSAWSIPAFEMLCHHRHILILGSGLTMVDVVLGLKSAGFSGNITSLSTHGFMPMPHGNAASYEMIDKPYQEIESALDILRIIRKHVRFAMANGIPWQAVIDSVRPYTQQVWHCLPLVEKRRFMEHLRHLWGIARHRVPPHCAAHLKDMMDTGLLNITAGRVRSIHKPADSRFIIEYRPRGEKQLRRMKAGSIINCMGPQSNFMKMDHPLIRNLLAKEIIRCDELRLGLDCTLDGALIGKNNAVSQDIYTIGPPSRGVFWEITSVPDIRNAARSLAKLITAARPREYSETTRSSSNI